MHVYMTCAERRGASLVDNPDTRVIFYRQIFYHENENDITNFCCFSGNMLELPMT